VTDTQTDTATLSTFGERLRWAIEVRCKSTITAFAKQHDLSRPVLSRWCNAADAPSEDTVQMLSRHTGVRPAWLRYGDGEPTISENADRIADEAHYAKLRHWTDRLRPFAQKAVAEIGEARVAEEAALAPATIARLLREDSVLTQPELRGVQLWLQQRSAESGEAVESAAVERSGEAGAARIGGAEDGTAALLQELEAAEGSTLMRLLYGEMISAALRAHAVAREADAMAARARAAERAEVTANYRQQLAELAAPPMAGPGWELSELSERERRLLARFRQEIAEEQRAAQESTQEESPRRAAS
jgi:hypothetical protein